MLTILYEDNHIIVVLKPQNVPTQPDSSGDVCLLDMIKDYIKTTYNKPGNVFVGMVHRLDRPTGGILVFAKTSKAASRLSEQIKTDVMQKNYLAVVQGAPREKRGVLTHYLRKNAKQNMVSVVPQGTKDSKEAKLEYITLQTKDKVSLVKVHLFTGRSHQIRVQLKQLGTPIFGDVKYGAELGAKRKLALWAYELKLEHPVTKVMHTFRAFPPLDEVPWKLFETESVFHD